MACANTCYLLEVPTGLNMHEAVSTVVERVFRSLSNLYPEKTRHCALNLTSSKILGFFHVGVLGSFTLVGECSTTNLHS